MVSRWVMFAGAMLFCGAGVAQEAPEFASEEAKLSYALGMALGKKLESHSIEVDPELYLQGLMDALSGGASKMTDEQVAEAMQSFQRELRFKQVALRAEKWKKMQAAAAGDAELKDIKVSFKLDPRLTRGVYMGDRWVSLPTYTGARQIGSEYTLEAKAAGLVEEGQEVRIVPEWSVSDPDMVTVTPTENGAVQISVSQAGESRLTVAANGVSRELRIKAVSEDGAMVVEVSQ
ncbi:FKBP-type peptidyl-prolyl cis-trans isomerase N-terminal domain-containing protein [Microbulbifer sp. YPW1]|uniref:FKBP-type peptidyl-prolyl cis-trans isomerase N-terminal domain-containing protein n=1 Tax=Microbulbifer sp. YPW1 TaxID=2745199 RepID=UPI0015977BD0|nr:FKBP-type peptidyl-prolyl cis-trans isomerase N-terminal domain-containing protein [Microbulbifer sp. YPW1]QKX18829.1 hypothetical protein HUW35_18675 [Microbulbifer sp. YPW1]